MDYRIKVTDLLQLIMKLKEIKHTFKTLDHEPTSNHLKIVSEWANKLFRKCEISKDWRNYIINEDPHPEKTPNVF